MRFIPIAVVLTAVISLTSCAIARNEANFTDIYVNKGEMTVSPLPDEVAPSDFPATPSDAIAEAGETEAVTEEELLPLDEAPVLDDDIDLPSTVIADKQPSNSAETKPAETKSAEVQPEEPKPAETKPAEIQPAETKPAETKPAETQPAADGHSHSYTPTVTAAATCLSDGVMTYTCTTCGDSYTAVIKASGHNWVEADCVSPRTCKNCGATEGEAIGHSYTYEITKEATCAETGERKCTCTVCGYTCTETIEKTGHKWKDAECDSPRVCSVCGETDGEPLGHNYVNGVCTRCGERESADISFSNGRTLAFGCSVKDVTSSWGEPVEIIKESYSGYSVSSYIYASDLKKLVILRFDGSGLGGVYSTDTSLSYENASGINVSAYTDGIGTGAIWSYYITSGSFNGGFDGLNGYTGTERLFWYVTNACRAINNLNSVVYSDTAASVARFHSADMADNDYTSHTGLNGSTPGTRLTAGGVYWMSCGENIVAGYFNVFDCMNGWYNSAGHRENLLGKDFVYLGVGMAYNASSTYKYYITQSFYA